MLGFGVQYLVFCFHRFKTSIIAKSVYDTELTLTKELLDNVTSGNVTFCRQHNRPSHLHYSPPCSRLALINGFDIAELFCFVALLSSGFVNFLTLPALHCIAL